MNNTSLIYSALAGAFVSGTYLWFTNRRPASSAQLPADKLQSETTVIGNKIRILDGGSLLIEPHRRALLQQIQDRLAFTPQSYDSDVLALIIKYAEFVQQLPASESHHHAHPGGLLDHTLEVASIALRISASLEMPLHTATEDRKKLAPVWRYGLLVAAILHDIGKTLTNLVVNLYESPESKDPIRWHPDAGDMLSIKDYCWYSVSFHDENPEYSAHSRLGWSLFNVIVPAHARNWIATTDPRLIEALRQYLTGTDIEPFDKVIKKSDSESTANNLRNGVKTRFASAKRKPIRELLMDNLREMLDSQAFTIGKDAGGEVFRFDGSKIFILSKVLADKLRNHINAKGNFTIPQDNDRIFGALFECGACLPNPFDKDKYNWIVCVEMKSGTHFFNGLCFDATSLYTQDMLWPNEYIGKITCVEAKSSLSEATNSNSQSIEAKQSPAKNSETSNDIQIRKNLEENSLLQQKDILAQIHDDSDLKQATNIPESAESDTNSMSGVSDSTSDELSDEDLVELAMKQLASSNEAANDMSAQPNRLDSGILQDGFSEPTDVVPQEQSTLTELPKSSYDKVSQSNEIDDLLDTIPTTHYKSLSKEKKSKEDKLTAPTVQETHILEKLGNQSTECKESLPTADFIRPVDIGTEIPIEALKLKFSIDDHLIDGKMPTESKQKLAIHFFSWLQQAAQNRHITINQPDSAFHVIENGFVLVTPRIFELFTGSSISIKEPNSPNKLVQQAFESQRMHVRNNVTGHWKAKVRPIGSKEPPSLNVYWIPDYNAKALFSVLPPINCRIELQNYGYKPKP